MDSFMDWLFGTETGVIVLLAAGLVICMVIALVMERKTRRLYYNHAKSEDDWSLFDDDDTSGWDDVDESPEAGARTQKKGSTTGK